MLKVFSAGQKHPLFDLLFQDGRVMSPADVHYPEVYRSLPLEERGVQSWEMCTAVLHLEDPQTMLKQEGLRNYLLGQKVKTLLTIPLISRGELNGCIAFGGLPRSAIFQPKNLNSLEPWRHKPVWQCTSLNLAKSAKRSAVLKSGIGWLARFMIHSLRALPLFACNSRSQQRKRETMAKAASPR
jgi:hypothetical protein